MQLTLLDGSVIRIAEADEDLLVDGDTWTALEGATISAVQHTLGGDMPSLELAFAHSVAGTFDTSRINHGFFEGAAVLVYIADRNNFAVGKGLLFTGVIQQVNYDVFGGGSFSIKGQASQDQTPIQAYGPMCRTDLFSSLCTLNSADYAQTGTINTITDKFTCTIAGLASPPATGHFDLGMGVNTTRNINFEIADWVQSTMTLRTFLPRCALFVAGDAVTLYPGCDKVFATCITKFGNNLNFQGEPHYAGVAAASGS